MTPDLEQVERRMQPGVWFTDGFLLGNTLLQVLATDERTLAGLGVTAEQVGQRLADLLETGAKSDWFQSLRTGEYNVEIRRRRGLITCPWAPDEFETCVLGHLRPPTANQFLIEHRGRGQRLEGFELSVHLIRDHKFFGGPGTRFRIEPKQAVAMLGLGPRLENTKV